MKYFLVCFSLLFISLGANANAQYYIVQDSLGSHIRYKVVHSGIPLDQSYAELSEQHKQIVRAGYGGLDDNIVPPFPKSGLRYMLTKLVDAQKYLNTRGKFVAIAVVDTAGKVRKVSVLKSPNEGITEFVSKMLKITEFSPGICDGAPCNSEYLLEFELDKEAASGTTTVQDTANRRTNRLNVTNDKVRVMIFQGAQGQ